MNIDICELVLLPLPPCVYLSQSEVEVMPTQPWCPLSTRCLSHVASHDLMISLKQLIIPATVCVMPEFIHSFIHSFIHPCVHALQQLLSSQLLPIMAVSMCVQDCLHALGLHCSLCSESCLLHLAPALWPGPPSLLLPYSYLPASLTVSLFCCHLRYSSHFIIWLTNPSWHPFHECLSKIK